MTAILHTQSGERLSVEFMSAVKWTSKRKLAEDVKKAMNDAGMKDRVVFVEVL